MTTDEVMQAKDNDRRHIISATVLNRPGVLARVAGLFSARGFNIESLAVGETEDPDVSRMTLVVCGDEDLLEQIRKQLRKLIDTIKVQDFKDTDCVVRDIMLIKINAPPNRRGQILEMVNVFQAKVVGITENTVIVEVSGPENKCESFIAMMKTFGIKEMARTGRIAMAHGD